MGTDPLADRYDRRFPYVRLPVIPACNFRCSYCLPHGYHAKQGAPEALSLDEIAQLLRGFAELGMHKLRITGGEPTRRISIGPKAGSAGTAGALSRAGRFRA